jgi:hypothetical protein
MRNARSYTSRQIFDDCVPILELGRGGGATPKVRSAVDMQELDELTIDNEVTHTAAVVQIVVCRLAICQMFQIRCFSSALGKRFDEGQVLLVDMHELWCLKKRKKAKGKKIEKNGEKRKKGALLDCLNVRSCFEFYL